MLPSTISNKYQIQEKKGKEGMMDAGVEFAELVVGNHQQGSLIMVMRYHRIQRDNRVIIQGKRKKKVLYMLGCYAITGFPWPILLSSPTELLSMILSYLNYSPRLSSMDVQITKLGCKEPLVFQNL